MIPADHKYAVVYTGAPYGDNEGGHVVSSYVSKGAAERAFDGREHTIVGLDDRTAGDRWVFGNFQTPRDFFDYNDR